MRDGFPGMEGKIGCGKLHDMILMIGISFGRLLGMLQGNKIHEMAG
jgi:hypothetical protein